MAAAARREEDRLKEKALAAGAAFMERGVTREKELVAVTMIMTTVMKKGGGSVEGKF